MFLSRFSVSEDIRECALRVFWSYLLWDMLPSSALWNPTWQEYDNSWSTSDGKLFEWFCVISEAQDKFVVMSAIKKKSMGKLSV